MWPSLGDLGRNWPDVCRMLSEICQVVAMSAEFGPNLANMWPTLSEFGPNSAKFCPDVPSWGDAGRIWAKSRQHLLDFERLRTNPPHFGQIWPDFAKSGRLPELAQVGPDFDAKVGFGRKP